MPENGETHHRLIAIALSEGLGISLTPLFFYVIRGSVGRQTPVRDPAAVAPVESSC
jgi:hypothetical protein